MNETIIQIIPAPSNLMYGYDGGTAQPVACLALVDHFRVGGAVPG